MPKKPWRRLGVPHYREAFWQAARHPLRAGQWAGGASVRALEARIAAALELLPGNVVATLNCSSALWAAWQLVGLHDLPSCPVLTYAGSYSPALSHVRLVDVADDGFAHHPTTLSVDLWGRAAPNDCVILDAAHRYAPEEQKHLFSRGVEFICYSFGPTKEISCMVGGALACVSSDAANHARWLLNQGISVASKKPTGMPGIKGYMPNPAAQWILRAMDCHGELRQRRQQVLAWYWDVFQKRMLTHPDTASGHLAVLDCGSQERRNRVRKLLWDESCESSIHYQIPTSKCDCCPTAAALSDRIVSLPCHHKMTRADVLRVARVVLRA